VRVSFIEYEIQFDPLKCETPSVSLQTHSSSFLSTNENVFFPHTIPSSGVIIHQLIQSKVEISSHVAK
jgi:hypothetical protein